MPNKLPKGLFVYGEDAELRKITANAPIYYYGFDAEGNDFVASDLTFYNWFDLSPFTFRGQELGQFHIPTFGRHNIMNATAVIGLLYTAGFDLNLVREHLKTLQVLSVVSLKKLSMIQWLLMTCSPSTEIIANLGCSSSKYPSKEIVAVFQPHTFTEPLPLLDEFAHALNQADAALLAQIYGSAREVDHGDVKVEDLANKINKKHQVITVENVSPLLDHDNAVYVFMGAGDIQTYEYSFERLLSNLTSNVQ